MVLTMNAEEKKERPRKTEKEFTERIGDRAARKQYAREQADRTLWHGLGAMGTVGWTVGLPLLLGVLLGTWIDSIWPGSPVSWRLTLMIGGLLFGVASAWRWLEGERKEIECERYKQESEQNNGE